MKYKCINDTRESDTSRIYMTSSGITIGKYYYTYDVPERMLEKYKDIIVDKLLYIKDDSGSLRFVSIDDFISVEDDREDKLELLGI